MMLLRVGWCGSILQHLCTQNDICTLCMVRSIVCAHQNCPYLEFRINGFCAAAKKCEAVSFSASLEHLERIDILCDRITTKPKQQWHGACNPWWWYTHIERKCSEFMHWASSNDGWYERCIVSCLHTNSIKSFLYSLRLWTFAVIQKDIVWFEFTLCWKLLRVLDDG